MPNLDDAFFPELRAWAAKMRADPADVLVLLYGESGLDPRSPGHVASYEGLNQMNRPYLQAHGIDPADYLTWPASRQMRAVVGPFLLSLVTQILKGAPVRSAGVLEAMNLYPAGPMRHGTAPASIVIDGQSADPSERIAFQSNRALDKDGDGKITIADLDTWLSGLAKQKAFQVELARLGPGGSATPLVVLGVLAALAALSYYVARR